MSVSVLGKRRSKVFLLDNEGVATAAKEFSAAEEQSFSISHLELWRRAGAAEGELDAYHEIANQFKQVPLAGSAAGSAAGAGVGVGAGGAGEATVPMQVEPTQTQEQAQETQALGVARQPSRAAFLRAFTCAQKAASELQLLVEVTTLLRTSKVLALRPFIPTEGGGMGGMDMGMGMGMDEGMDEGEGGDAGGVLPITQRIGIARSYLHTAALSLHAGCASARAVMLQRQNYARDLGEIKRHWRLCRVDKKTHKRVINRKFNPDRDYIAVDCSVGAGVGAGAGAGMGAGVGTGAKSGGGLILDCFVPLLVGAAGADLSEQEQGRCVRTLCMRLLLLQPSDKATSNDAGGAAGARAQGIRRILLAQSSLWAAEEGMGPMFPDFIRPLAEHCRRRRHEASCAVIYARILAECAREAAAWDVLSDVRTVRTVRTVAPVSGGDSGGGLEEVLDGGVVDGVLRGQKLYRHLIVSALSADVEGECGELVEAGMGGVQRQGGQQGQKGQKGQEEQGQGGGCVVLRISESLQLEIYMAPIPTPATPSSAPSSSAPASSASTSAGAGNGTGTEAGSETEESGAETETAAFLLLSSASSSAAAAAATGVPWAQSALTRLLLQCCLGVLAPSVVECSGGGLGAGAGAAGVAGAGAVGAGAIGSVGGGGGGIGQALVQGVQGMQGQVQVLREAEDLTEAQRIETEATRRLGVARAAAEQARQQDILYARKGAGAGGGGVSIKQGQGQGQAGNAVSGVSGGGDVVLVRELVRLLGGRIQLQVAAAAASRVLAAVPAGATTGTATAVLRPLCLPGGHPALACQHILEIRQASSTVLIGEAGAVAGAGVGASAGAIAGAATAGHIIASFIIGGGVFARALPSAADSRLMAPPTVGGQILALHCALAAAEAATAEVEAKGEAKVEEAGTVLAEAVVAGAAGTSSSKSSGNGSGGGRSSSISSSGGGGGSTYSGTVVAVLDSAEAFERYLAAEVRACYTLM